MAFRPMPKRLVQYKSSASAKPNFISLNRTQLPPPRLCLQLDKQSVLCINGLQARFGMTGNDLRNNAFAILVRSIPVEHIDLYREAAQELSMKTSKFPLGLGRLWMSKGAGTTGLFLRPTRDLYALYTKMSGLPGFEAVEEDRDIFVEVLGRSKTSQRRLELFEQLKNTWGRVPLGMASGLRLHNGHGWEDTIPFADSSALPEGESSRRLNLWTHSSNDKTV